MERPVYSNKDKLSINSAIVTERKTEREGYEEKQKEKGTKQAFPVDDIPKTKRWVYLESMKCSVKLLGQAVVTSSIHIYSE